MTRLCCAPGVQGSLKSANTSADQLCCHKTQDGAGGFSTFPVLASAAELNSARDECARVLLWNSAVMKH